MALLLDRKLAPDRGFSLIEAIVGIGIMGIVLLGLAQFFTVSVMSNLRSDRVSSAVFLVQQKIDSLKNATEEELNALASNTGDELLDINNDGTNDFRRITRVEPENSQWNVRVLLFSIEQANKNIDSLIQNPLSYKLRGQMNTIISR
jgi:prepilin-type N-terminal cleavage/methylation domain-containing protein